jgi:hypothetical protein
MYHGTVLVFGGTIEEWTEAAYPGQSGNLILVKCTDFSNLLDRHIIGEYYPANPSDPDAPRLGLMVADIANKYLATDGILYDGSDGSPGLVMGAQLFAWQTIRQVFNTLANLTGWDFSVDYNKVLRFFPHLTGRGTAPFNIADGDKNVLSDEASATSGSTSLSIRTYRGTYRNRQYVRSSSAVSPLWHDIFSSTNQGPYPNSPQPPDGTRFFFVTLYGIISTPTVTVNGVTQRVISFLDLATTPSANWDWYWIPQQGAPNPAPGVGQNMNNARLTASDTLIVGYPTNIPSIYSVDCTAQIVDRAAIEGNSGIYADIQDAGNITDPSAIAQYALGLLNRYGCTNGMPTQVLYSTDSAGLFAGMLQTIQRSKPLIASGVYQISSVSFRDIDGKFLRYQVTADSGQFQGDWTQFFGQIQTAIQLPQPANRMVYNWLLAPSYPGITNPGLGAGGTQPQLQVIQNPFESFQYFTIAFPTPTTADLDVNILQNGTTTGYYTVPAGTQGSKTFYYAQALSYPAGTTMQVFVNTHGGTIKDAIVTLVTSVVVSA